jgi:hypothetical protein
MLENQKDANFCITSLLQEIFEGNQSNKIRVVSEFSIAKNSDIIQFVLALKTYAISHQHILVNS